MQISSTRQSHQRPFIERQPQNEPEPQDVSLTDVAPAAGGVLLGGVSAVLGHQLAQNYGHQVAQTLIRKGMPLIANGTVSLECAFKALPYVTDLAVQLRVGALSFGLAGFAVGAALLWPREA
jgi:hypothetical protein